MYNKFFKPPKNSVYLSLEKYFKMGTRQPKKKIEEQSEIQKTIFKKSGILTNLSVKEIEDMIVGTANLREELFVPNVSWGFFKEHEADLVRITRAGCLTEYEIKRSWTDFLADFKKHSYHADDRISWLYYVVPECMAEEAVKYIVPDKRSAFNYHAGVLGFGEDGRYKMFLECNYPKQRKLYVEDMYDIARLGVLRYWSLRRKIDEQNKKMAEQ